jgi:hypothetical protein
MAPRVTWRLLPDDAWPSMPVLESSMLPEHGGQGVPIFIREVRTRSSADGLGDVFIDCVLALGDGAR